MCQEEEAKERTVEEKLKLGQYVFEMEYFTW